MQLRWLSLPLRWRARKEIGSMVLSGGSSRRRTERSASNAMNGHFYDKSLAGVYEAVGGTETFRRISKRFHHKIEQDPALRGFFPKNMAALEERLALYLAERTGGPSDYTTARSKNSLYC